MYMRQFMQLLMAFVILVPSTVTASGSLSGGNVTNNPVKTVAVADEVRTVIGTVYDAATNLPMAGVRVQATGHTKITAMTNAEGKYKISVPEYVTLLTFSTPGYLLVQRPVISKDVVNIRLYSDKFKGGYEDEIVITSERGFKNETTTSVTIDSDIQNKLGADVRSITRSGTTGIGAAMFIRGLNSLNANTQPLYVVDGVIWDSQEDSETIHMGMYNNILTSIDVSDIREVKVLKNATAIYGARAANGVIIINTKRGESMATRITANIYSNVSLQPNTYNMMGAEDYRIYASDLVSTMDINPNTKNLQFLRSDKDFLYYNKYHNNTDWTDLVYRESYTQNYKINVEGGDEIAMYNFSFGYTNGTSPIKSNSFDRLNLRLNSDISLAKFLKTRVDISYSRVARNLLDDGLREDETSFPLTSIGTLADIKSPFLSQYRYSSAGTESKVLDVADTFAFDAATAAGISNPNNSIYNPMTIINKGTGSQKNEMEYSNMGITVAPELKLGDFTITETFNYSLHRVSEKYFLPYATASDQERYFFFSKSLNTKIGNYVSSFFGKEAAISSDTRVDWSKVFGSHNVSAFGGFRYTSFNFDSNYLSAPNTGNDNNFNLNGVKEPINDGDKNVWKNMAWYLSADYSYRTKYFLQLAASLETSSRFGLNADGALKMCGVSWGFFPSVQAGWLMSSESWFNVQPVNFLKLRAGYDVTGNDAIDYFAARSYLQAVKFSDSYMGLQFGNMENDGVKWESTSRLNLGFDAMLFQNRLALSFDWYHAKTKDLIVQKTYPYISGMGTYWANGGALKNVGLEATLNAKLINTRDFQWELGLSLGHYKNEIVSLDEGSYTTSVYGGEIATMVGQPVGVFWGYKTDGVISSQKEIDEMENPLYQLDATNTRQYFKPGDVKFVNIVGEDGCIDESDKTIIGNPNPDLFGNIFTAFTLKGVKLDIGFNYSLGNDVYNYYRRQLESGSSFYNQTTAMLTRWSFDGQVTEMPIVEFGDPTGNSRFSDRWIEDGSYLRLKTVKLSYDIPVSVNWLQGLSVWCAAENLYTLTKYKGMDPEFSVNNNVLYQGVDAGLLPQTRSFHLGVKVNL
ncbi:MAG: SusC/RagA family TonB-linked outer membrane protein [Bacteroidaceae bacterium]|nr:SusC/RagA family TonB-linked outer membrane protein [Bacteroidaceae bacterium]